MKVRNKIEIVIMAIILVLVIVFVSIFSVHQFSSNEIRVKNFFLEKKNSLDVVNIGASEIYTGFSPEYLWKQYGITSYNLATSGGPMALAKSEVQAVLENQNPQLITISINGAGYNNKRARHEGFTRMWLDNMPDGKLHDEAINDLVHKDKITYKLKFLKYHDNILRFTECISLSMRELKTKKNKNLLTISTIQGKATTDEKRDLVDISKYKVKEKLGKYSKEQLEDLIKFLKAKKVKNVAFVNMPRYYEKDMLESKAEINTAKAIVKKAGFKFYDFDNDVYKIGLDPQHDFYNRLHVNIYGQRKMSDYFQKTVMKDFGVKPKHKDDENIKKDWNSNLAVYEKFYKWADHTIETKGIYEMEYNYNVIDHLLAGTIEDYEKTLIFKAKIADKKNDKKERKNFIKKQNKANEFINKTGVSPPELSYEKIYKSIEKAQKGR